MITIHTEIDINAPINKVWQILTRFTDYPQWNPFIAEITGALTEGAKLNVKVIPVGQKPMRFTPTLTRVIDDKELKWLGRVLGGSIFSGEHKFILSKKSEQITHFIQQEDFSGLLHKIIMKKIQKSTEAGFISMNNALKNRCEAT